jgi:hypothetical protein
VRYREIAAAGPMAERSGMRTIREHLRAAHAARIHPEISMPTADQRAAMSHVVECPGLTVHGLGEAFAEEFQGRRLWCRENCRSEFSVEPIRDGTSGRDTGRCFLFACEDEAARFRRRWG